MSATPIAPALVSEALTWPARARTVQVYDIHSQRRAVEALLQIKEHLRAVADAYNPHIARLHAAHKELLASRKEVETPLVEAEALIKAALSAYDIEQAKERAEAQERLRRDAVAQEEQRRLDEAARLKDEAAATGNLDLLHDAAALLEQPVEVPAIFVPEPAPIAGIQHRETWRAEVKDLRALIGCVAARPDLTHLLQANQTALNQMARAQRDRLALDGVVAVRVHTVAAGR